MLIVVIFFPVISNYAPAYWGTPDIQYVKAKTLRVMEGDIFTDPVTGIPNFHPPYYHLFLSSFISLGINIDTILLWVSIANMLLLLLFTYLIIKEYFDHESAFYVVLLIPFILEFMGPGYAFLATSFYFSLSFYLAGLWLYLKESVGIKCLIGLSTLWGCAFLLSPVFLFIIALTVAYEFLFKKEYRRATIMALSLGLICIPFIIQALTIYRADLSGTSAFSFWRGFPDNLWLRDLAKSFISPQSLNVLLWSSGFSMLIMVAGVAGIVKQKTNHHIVVIAFFAYILTAYHFNLAYASRIQFILSVFLAGFAVWSLREKALTRAVRVVLVLIITCYGVFNTVEQLSFVYAKHEQYIHDHEKQRYLVRQHILRYIKPGTFVLASEETYRYQIMPYYPIFGLVAYRTGEYFQLNGKLAQEMVADYNTIIDSDDISIINRYCEKYKIDFALSYGRHDMQLPAFTAIAKHWSSVYSDQFFVIFRRNPR